MWLFWLKKNKNLNMSIKIKQNKKLLKIHIYIIKWFFP